MHVITRLLFNEIFPPVENIIPAITFSKTETLEQGMKFVKS